MKKTSPQSYKIKIKIPANNGLASLSFEQPGPVYIKRLSTLTLKDATESADFGKFYHKKYLLDGPT